MMFNFQVAACRLDVSWRQVCGCTEDATKRTQFALPEMKFHEQWGRDLKEESNIFIKFWKKVLEVKN